MRRRHRSAESTPPPTGGSASRLRLSRSAEEETEYQKYLKSSVWIRKRAAVLKRDGGRCAHPDCRSTRNVHVHHTRYPKRWGREPLSWLITLCAGHHRFVHRLAKQNNYSLDEETRIFLLSKTSPQEIDGRLYQVTILPDGTRPKVKTWGTTGKRGKNTFAKKRKRRRRTRPKKGGNG